MQVKTFSGPNNKVVLDKIKAELGSEAVILESRTTMEDGKKIVRMVAALEKDDAAALADEPFAADGHNGGLSGTGWKQWQAEWHNIKSNLFALMRPALRLDALNPRQRTAMEYLEREGANDQVLLELYRKLSQRPDDPVLVPLSSLLPVKSWSLQHWPQRVHLVSGPYGSGKSTSVVRMALALQQEARLASISEGDKARECKVCLVNADAERGNGRLLLRHYAGLSGLEYREAGTAMKFAAVLAEAQHRGFSKIIVDMPALRRGETLNNVAANLGVSRIEGLQTALHLVLSPHYDDSLTLDLLNRYMLDMPGSLVWSKLDEASRYGALLNVAMASGLPVSCFSFGPELLHSMQPARQSMLWRLLFKHELPVTAAPQVAADESGARYE